MVSFWSEKNQGEEERRKACDCHFQGKEQTGNEIGHLGPQKKTSTGWTVDTHPRLVAANRQGMQMNLALQPRPKKFRTLMGDASGGR